MPLAPHLPKSRLDREVGQLLNEQVKIDPRVRYLDCPTIFSVIKILIVTKRGKTHA